jgi:hypothetical protein
MRRTHQLLLHSTPALGCPIVTIARHVPTSPLHRCADAVAASLRRRDARDSGSSTWPHNTVSCAA